MVYQNFRAIETRAKQMADTMQAGMDRAAAGVAGVFRNFGSAAGIGGLGLSALFATAVKLNGELAKIPGLAREAGLSTDRLQQVKFAASIKGLGDEDFVASMRTSLGLLDEAQRQVNSLQRLFNANNLSIRDSNGELLKFDDLLETAARLMVNAPTEQAKIRIADMLGLSRDWIAVLRDGPEAFRRAAAEAGNAGAIIDKDILAKAKEFDLKWKEAIVRFKAGIVDALTDLAGEFSRFWSNIFDGLPGVNFLSDLLDKWAGGLRDMSLPQLQDAIKRGIEQGVDQVEIDRLQAEIDRRLRKQPLKVTVTPEIADTPTVIPKDKQKNPFDAAVFEANKRIAALDAETESIGLNTEARERAKLVATLEEAAIKANTDAGYQNATVTDVQREKINALADAMEDAARRQRESHEALMRFAVEGRDFTKQFDQFAISAFGSLENAFASLVTGAKTAKEAFSDMAKAILEDLARMIIRMQITAPLARALGGFFSGGGGGGVAAGGFHRGGTGPGEASFTRLVDPAVFVGAPRFHSGIGAGEMAAIIRSDESVLTPGQMKALAPVGRAGGGNVQVTVNNAPAGTNATATTSRDGAGNMRIDVWLQRQVDDTAAALVDTGESAMNKSIERRYGLTPRL